jgi:protein-S-isoprenylcysteine O-methyltransferase Ste14
MRSLTVIIGISWIIFWLYWIVSAFGSKKSTGSNISHIKQFVGIRVILIVLVVILTPLFNRLPYSFKNHYLAATNNETVLVLGFIMFLLGLFVAVWARIYLGKNWGMPMTQKQDPELVTSGPYRYIRHPIYSGILLMALGSAFDVNIYWLLVFIIAGFFFIYSAVAEEQLMMKQFPKVYPSYKRKTKMLIPFVL